MRSASLITADTTQMRYQKALKQITKLIGLNTQLRQQINRVNQQMLDMKLRIQDKEEVLKRIICQRDQFEVRLNNWSSVQMSIVVENKELKKQLERMKSLNETSSILRKKDTKDSYLQNSQNHIMIGQFEREIDLRDEKIEQVQTGVFSFKGELKSYRKLDKTIILQR